MIEYVEGGDPAGMSFELRRVDDVLGRQGKLLHRLAARSPRDLRKVVVKGLGVDSTRVMKLDFNFNLP